MTRHITAHKGGRTARAPEARIRPQTLERIRAEMRQRGMSFADLLEEQYNDEAAASRANGRRGGRPKKEQEKMKRETSEVFVRRNELGKYEVVEKWGDGTEKIVSTFDTRQDANEYAGDYRKIHA